MVALYLWLEYTVKTQQSIPSKPMSFPSKGSNDCPWLYVVFMSVIFEVQVHLATSSLLDQLLRNLTGKQAPQTGSASDKSQVIQQQYSYGRYC